MAVNISVVDVKPNNNLTLFTSTSVVRNEKYLLHFILSQFYARLHLKGFRRLNYRHPRARMSDQLLRYLMQNAAQYKS